MIFFIKKKLFSLTKSLCQKKPALFFKAEASREADAKVVSASGELNASHALSQAADRFGSSSTGKQNS